MGPPQRRRSRHQKRSLHPRGGGGQRHRRAASQQPRKGGGGAGGPQPALSKPPSHGRGQATDASRVARALHPQQAQAGSGGRGGQHSRQSTSTRTSSPSRGKRPLRSGLHQIGYCDASRGRGEGEGVCAPERIRDPGQGAREGPQRRHLSPWCGSLSHTVYTKGEAWGAARWLCHVPLLR